MKNYMPVTPTNILKPKQTGGCKQSNACFIPLQFTVTHPEHFPDNLTDKLKTNN